AALQPGISGRLDRRPRRLVHLLPDELRAGAARARHGVADAGANRRARSVAGAGAAVSGTARPPGDGGVLDVERVVCRETELEATGVRAFTIGGGDWPLRGFVVRVGAHVRGYVNRCPHAGHPLNLLPDRFLTPDGALILCSSHGALFEKLTGFCVAG